MTLGTQLDLLEFRFSLLLNGHENWSSHIESMREINEIMYVQSFAQLLGTY